MLIVDDDQGLREYVRVNLEAEGYVVREAASAAEGLAALGGLRVVHTPGHTPGSICLYSPERRLVIVGDILQRLRGVVTYPNELFTDDMVLARRSIALLADLDIETILFSHYPALREGARDALRGLAS